MTGRGIYVRLADIEGHMDEENLAKVEKFTLHCGHESNEAGIAELRDADGMNVEPDGRRWKNHG
ncbi:hypothetical protein [uncultured Salinicola sp.]|uniref:hypothetical protein n=1 Tax=uncultured Salinicola sp. TaxID=1193542 RepID=UPI002620559F|nr:hypothetical protein [uncultured Salinicola sp.]|tara:strand:- start:1131 stop:1322 length:192 start_codon:yes stop_codon:yes gene_type:complete